MRCGVPLLSKRVAPRCTAADTLMVVTTAGGRVISQDLFPVQITGDFDLVDAIRRHRIDTLICGGISRDTKDTVLSLVVEIVDNVACSAEEIVPALERGALAPGFGLSENEEPSRLTRRTGHASTGDSGLPPEQQTAGGDIKELDFQTIDCLLCHDRMCLDGQNCLAVPVGRDLGAQPETRRMIETAFDIAQEQERRLCRIAEIVYFCLEMNYRRIGVAFCIELLEPARILTGVLRRFFEVVPVCCKVGGVSFNWLSGAPDDEAPLRSTEAIACNPHAQAEILNHRNTDLNLIVGLCVGADSLFAHASRAPVSTLFVKDRSLANNPIGALYSDYYLRESVSPAPGRDLTANRGTSDRKRRPAQATANSLAIISSKSPKISSKGVL